MKLACVFTLFPSGLRREAWMMVREAWMMVSTSKLAYVATNECIPFDSTPPGPDKAQKC